MTIEKHTLAQAIVVEKGLKTRVYNEVQEIHKSTAKVDPCYGFVKNYQPVAENGMAFPPEHKIVQVNIAEAIKRIAKLQTQLFDITATREWANTLAKADVIVDGKVLIAQVPVGYLLFLEKQLLDMKKLVGSFVELDAGHTWTWDDGKGYYVSEELSTHRTEKVQDVRVIVPATEQHPAQTKEFTQDKIVGWWKARGHSGAIMPTQKRAILDRIETLADAVKSARERANMIEAQRHNVGAPIFEYLFAK